MIIPPNDILAKKASPVFWGEIAPCEHLVEIYLEEDVFLDSLEGFVAGGLEVGDGVIVIATPSHRKALEDRLTRRGVDLANARLRDQYIDLDAEETISKFLVNGFPDAERFEQLVTSLLARARGTERRVRAFGEMVAILWGRGLNGATVRLEHLWHQFCQKEAFSLFCAYPRSGFTENAEVSIKTICDAHSRRIGS